MMNDHWEVDIADLLAELTAAQSDLLDLLAEKRTILLRADAEALQALQSREVELFLRLEACQHRRQQLLDRAADEGRPADSIRTLTDSLSSPGRAGLQSAVDAARSNSRLLRHESLANWVMMQRSLLHLSQIIEIIATRGRLQPTYGRGAPDTGALVDRAV
jgi:hypothetical protein